VTKVSPSDDIEGINNFDIFVIQEGAKTSGRNLLTVPIIVVLLSSVLDPLSVGEQSGPFSELV
jgi:hypothetical protein